MRNCITQQPDRNRLDHLDSAFRNQDSEFVCFAQRALRIASEFALASCTQRRPSPSECLARLYVVQAGTSSGRANGMWLGGQRSQRNITITGFPLPSPPPLPYLPS